MSVHRLGIMQGRLTPITDGRIQAYPTDNWRGEMVTAARLGFDVVEWVVDSDSLDSNVLFTGPGRREINDARAATDIDIPLVCVDVFMDEPLTTGAPGDRSPSRELLLDLIEHGPAVGIRQIEIPLIGDSSVEDPEDEASLTAFVASIEERLRRQSVQLLFEVSLGPDRAAGFIGRLPADVFALNYDTGNSAYWEFDVRREIGGFGNRIGNVHIKDCTPADYSVALGDGNVDFDLTFSLLAGAGYQGDFVLQAARGEDDEAIAQIFADFTRGYIERYLSGPARAS